MAKTLGNDPNVYFIAQLDDFIEENEIYSPMEVSKEFVAELADTYPEVIGWTVIGSHSNYQWQYDEKRSCEGPFTISVTPAFTEFITIPMEEGCLETILSHPNAVAITRTYANQIFPGENPIGKTISGKHLGCIITDDGVEIREHKTLVVEGIIDDNFRSFLNLRAIFSRSEEEVRNNPHAGSFSAMLKLREGVDPEDFLDKIANDSVLNEKHYAPEILLHKISDAYFEFPNDEESLYKTRDKNTLIIGLTIALIILIISAFNYLNITLIRAPKRLKNLAGQRIMGASKKEIAAQVIAETALHVCVGFLLALIFIPSAMQLFNSYMGSELQWQDLIRWNNLPYILLLLGVLIIIPAIYLIAKFNIKQPMEVFKNPTGNKIHYFGSLVVLQIIISVVLITFSINVKRQMDKIASTVPNAHQVICIEQNGEIFTHEFRNRLLQSATTTEYLSGAIHPNSSWGAGNSAYLFRETMPNYFDFLRIPIIMGRTFDSIPTEIKQVVANKTFIKQREIEEPLGYEFEIYRNKFRIVGVCEDFNTQNATSKIPATLYTFHDGYWKWQINIRFQGSLENKIAEIENLYALYNDKEDYDYEYDDEDEYEDWGDYDYDEDNDEIPDIMALLEAPAFMPKINTMADYYINLNPEVKRLRIMIEFFAFISIFLSALGLFGLSWYTVERRHKEMALRKVHGASTGKLLLLLCKTFFIWCVIATIIALPIGYYISKYWLEGFVHRIDNSLWTLVLTALIAATVTFLTVIFQTTRAARANPAKYIKME
jgi:ABC-type antimicrobial peptide transport system permease subunit